ncbi:MULTISPECIES: hypothetical protein [unclassified Micromonospora]|uniref:hypothetical protein n=1 Tax=unclassified Micromonospora TaxID=2617518 RepID=UPI002416B2D3|nr:MULTISPECIES: hypothetical protein [unclassified Micromonospora]MDG4817013.1 hypothetical protein [Micromonospora sp. WMMD956]WFE59589.1 hypothetical protein O7633_23260 [Micromonospora sp. WMMD712]
MTRDDLDADVLKAVRRAAWTRQAFYALVLAVALIGQVTGAAQTLDVPLIIAIPAVATLELGGVVVMADANVRRRLGERALASRLLSAAIAASAVTFNWAAHPDHLLGGFYAAMSALGYLVWLLHAGNQRRDRLRATGNLPPTPPAYEVIGHWLRHPAITLRARTIAKADGLDLYDSLRHARATIEREHRNAAIAKVLHRKIRAALDTTTADIAVRVYDLDEVADRLTATADYNEITNLLAADLTPKRIITADNARGRRWLSREGHVPAPRAPEPRSFPPSPSSWLTAATSADEQQVSEPEPDRSPVPDPKDEQPLQAESRSSVPPQAVPAADEAIGADGRDVAGDDEVPDVPRETREAVAYWLRREPDIEPERIAERIGKSLRSVYRYLPPDYPRRPGIARQRTRRHLGPARQNSQRE